MKLRLCVSLCFHLALDELFVRAHSRLSQNFVARRRTRRGRFRDRQRPIRRTESPYSQVGPRESESQNEVRASSAIVPFSSILPKVEPVTRPVLPWRARVGEISRLSLKLKRATRRSLNRTIFAISSRRTRGTNEMRVNLNRARSIVSNSRDIEKRHRLHRSHFYTTDDVTRRHN